MLKDKKKKFNELYNEYFSEVTQEDRKQELVELMQQRLRDRLGTDNTVVGLDGKEYSVSSENVSDLLAIHRKLINDVSMNTISEIGERKRKDSEDTNKYGPNNPYE